MVIPKMRYWSSRGQKEKSSDCSEYCMSLLSARGRRNNVQFGPAGYPKQVTVSQESEQRVLGSVRLTAFARGSSNEHELYRVLMDFTFRAMNEFEILNEFISAERERSRLC